MLENLHIVDIPLTTYLITPLVSIVFGRPFRAKCNLRYQNDEVLIIKESLTKGHTNFLLKYQLRYSHFSSCNLSSWIGKLMTICLGKNLTAIDRIFIVNRVIVHVGAMAPSLWELWDLVTSQTNLVYLHPQITLFGVCTHVL